MNDLLELQNIVTNLFRIVDSRYRYNGSDMDEWLRNEGARMADLLHDAQRYVTELEEQINPEYPHQQLILNAELVQAIEREGVYEQKIQTTLVNRTS